MKQKFFIVFYLFFSWSLKASYKDLTETKVFLADILNYHLKDANIYRLTWPYAQARVTYYSWYKKKNETIKRNVILNTLFLKGSDESQICKLVHQEKDSKKNRIFKAISTKTKHSNSRPRRRIISKNYVIFIDKKGKAFVRQTVKKDIFIKKISCKEFD